MPRELASVGARPGRSLTVRCLAGPHGSAHARQTPLMNLGQLLDLPREGPRRGPPIFGHLGSLWKRRACEFEHPPVPGVCRSPLQSTSVEKK